MYPPSTASDSVQQESNRAQGVRVLALLWVGMGLFTIIAHHDLLSGSGQVGIGMATAINEILVKKAVPKKWRIGFKISAFVVLLVVFAVDWLFRK